MIKFSAKFHRDKTTKFQFILRMGCSPPHIESHMVDWPPPHRTHSHMALLSIRRLRYIVFCSYIKARKVKATRNNFLARNVSFWRGTMTTTATLNMHTVMRASLLYSIVAVDSVDGKTRKPLKVSLLLTFWTHLQRFIILMVVPNKKFRVLGNALWHVVVKKKQFGNWWC